LLDLTSSRRKVETLECRVVATGQASTVLREKIQLRRLFDA